MKQSEILRISICIVSLLTLLSCASEPTQKELSPTDRDTQATLYPRRTEAPIVLTLPVKDEGSLRGAIDSEELYSFLARTYDPTAGILNSMECYKRPLFDIDALIKYRSTAVDFLSLKSFDASYASFSSKESYEQHLEQTFQRSTLWMIISLLDYKEYYQPYIPPVI